MIATRTLSILFLLELFFVPMFASAGPADPVLMGIQLSQINFDVINGLLIDKCNVSYPSTVPALKDAIDKWKSKNTDALNELHQITKNNLIKMAHLSEYDATAKIAQTSEFMTNGLKAQFENISGDQLKEACNGKYVAMTLQTLDFPSVLSLIHSANAKANVNTLVTMKAKAIAEKSNVVQGELIWMPISFAKNWSDADAYCSNTEINGLTDWRLPTKDELVALYHSGAMKVQEVPGWNWGTAWSSTHNDSGNRNGHFFVSLDIGYVFPGNATGSGSFMCVRDLKQK